MGNINALIPAVEVEVVNLSTPYGKHKRSWDHLLMVDTSRFLLPMGNINSVDISALPASVHLSTPYGKHKLGAFDGSVDGTAPFYSLWET